MTLTPQLPRWAGAWAKEDGVPFPVLTDLGNGVARTYRLAFELPEDLVEVYREIGIDLERFNGDESWTLPIPAGFVVGPDGVIAYSSADPDYRVRPEPEELLEALDRL